MSTIPAYREAFSNTNALRAAIAIAKSGGVANFSDICKLSGVKSSTLDHSLSILIEQGVVEKEVKGTYRMKYLTPLCYLFATKRLPIAYLGLLGKRNGRKEPETKTALRLLKAEGIEPTSTYVLTTSLALKDWETTKPPYEWIICYEDEISDIDAVKKRVEKQLKLLLRDHLLIMDCTSATKPATIAYYELARTYQTPLIYIYEPKLKLKWLQSKETITKEIIPAGKVKLVNNHFKNSIPQ